MYRRCKIFEKGHDNKIMTFLLKCVSMALWIIRAFFFLNSVNNTDIIKLHGYLKKHIWYIYIYTCGINRKSPRELLLWKGDLKLCIRFTGEHPQSKCHFIKVSFCQNHFYRNTFGRFLLYKDISWKNPNLFTGIFFMNFFKTRFSFLKYPT